MASPITLVSDQKVAIGVTILDKGGEPFASPPPGTTVTFESSNPSIVGVVVRPDGLNADLSSDDIGVSTITVSAIKGNGTHLEGSPDTLEVTVVNAEVGTMTLTVGAPEPE
jgi:hypothetical protein